MSRTWTRIGIGAGLALVTVVAFADVWNAGFLTYDDDVYVTASPPVLAGLTAESLRWSLTAVISSNWHPLTLWSLMLDVTLFGADPRAMHAVNLALHVANTLGLFALLVAMTGATWRSAFVAAAFALHPLHVESVAWVSERKDVLSTLFWLLATGAYVRWTRTGGRTAYAAALGLLGLGLLAKSMLVTWPFVALLFDVWPLRRIAPDAVLRPRAWWPRVREKLPFFAVTALISAIALGTQGTRARSPMWSFELLPLGARLENAVVSYARYLQKLVWPSDLAVFYPHALDQPAAAVVGALAVLALASAAAFAVRRRAPYLPVGWLFFLGTLVPTIGLIQVGNQALADRYTYVPALGLFWIAAWGAHDLAGRTRPGRIALGAVALVALSGLTAQTLRHVPLWRDTRTLFEHAVRVTRPNATAHNTLAHVAVNDRDLDRALYHVDEALRIEPRYAAAHAQRGLIQLARGEPDAAARSLAEALARHPERSPWHFQLGFAHEQRGDLTGAEESYRAGLALDPDLPEVESRLGRIRARQGDLDGAIAIFRGVLQRHPDEPRANENLGLALDQRGETALAVTHYERALAAAPEARRSLRRLAWVRATHPDASLRDGAEAVRLAERACAQSEYGDARDLDRLAAAYAEAGRFDDAVRTAERALASAGESALAAKIGARKQRYAAGKPHREAVTLGPATEDEP